MLDSVLYTMQILDWCNALRFLGSVCVAEGARASARAERTLQRNKVDERVTQCERTKEEGEETGRGVQRTKNRGDEGSEGEGGIE